MTMTLMASTTLGNVAVHDTCPIPGSVNFALIEATTPSLRVFNSTTLAYILSSTCVSAPIGVSMINAASAIINSSLNGTLDLVEVSTGYRQNYAGGLTISTSRAGQTIAGDPSQSIAMGCSNSSSVVRFSGITFTASQIVLQDNSNDVVKCIILKGPNRWLVGTSQGMVFEIDSAGYVWDLWNVRLNTWPLGSLSPLGGTVAVTVNQLAYDTNILLLELGVATMLVDWSTKTILKTYAPESSSVIPPIFFCNASSGVILMGPVSPNPQQILYEVDMTVYPLSVRGFMYMDGTGNTSAINMNASGWGWWSDTSSPAKLRSFTVVPRDTTLRTITVLSASANGIHQQARLTIIDDTSGVGTSSVLLDTFMQSPAVYRVPTGRTLMEMTKVGLGSLAAFDLNRYNT